MKAGLVDISLFQQPTGLVVNWLLSHIHYALEELELQVGIYIV